MGPCRRARQILADGPLVVKADSDRLADRQALHLLEDVLDPHQAALASEELHGLEEPGAHCAPGGGEAQGVYEVARTLLLLCGQPSDTLFDGLLGPLRQGGEALMEFRE